MISYKIVYAECEGSSHDNLCKSLEANVEVLLNEGWTCVGGVALIFDTGIIYNMYQAMVKMTD